MMTPEDWLEGLKNPVYIDDPVGGGIQDSVRAYRHPFLEDGARLMRELMEANKALRNQLARLECFRMVRVGESVIPSSALDGTIQFLEENAWNYPGARSLIEGLRTVRNEQPL